MSELAELKCVSCRGGVPTLTDEEISNLHPQVADWKLVLVNGIQRLERRFKLKDFVAAIEFTNKVGEIAEEEDHHPLIVTEWGRVKVQWWTHKIKGLHQNDFIMTAKVDILTADAQN